MQIQAAHEAAAVKALPEAALFIGGERVTTGTARMERLDPTTGGILGSFPVAQGRKKLDRAVRGAARRVSDLASNDRGPASQAAL